MNGSDNPSTPVATVDALKEAMSLGGNILIEGMHGTGKTTMLRQAASELGYSIAYYNGPTIDPYTDLVGIPFVSEDEETGERHMEMVQPKQIVDADVKFFDEVNRAKELTRNALMETIIEGSINGKKLKNHKLSVAAINPANGVYSTGSLDPAFIDRFDFYFTVSEKPNMGYFRSKFGKFGEIAVSWWSEQFSTMGEDINEADYLSPRRLDKILTFFTRSIEKSSKVMSFEMFQSLFPPAGMYATNLLYKSLVKNYNKESGNAFRVTESGYLQSTIDTFGTSKITRNSLRDIDDAELAEAVSNDDKLAEFANFAIPSSFSIVNIMVKPLTLSALIDKGYSLDDEDSQWVHEMDGVSHGVSHYVTEDGGIKIRPHQEPKFNGKMMKRRDLVLEGFKNIDDAAQDPFSDYARERYPWMDMDDEQKNKVAQYFDAVKQVIKKMEK